MLTALLPTLVTALASHLIGHLGTGILSPKKRPEPSENLLKWLQQNTTKPQS